MSPTEGYTLAQYSYIGNTGLMSGMTYGNNDGIAYTYDNDYRLTKTVYTDKNTAGTVLGTKTVGYEYDIFGNVYKLTDGFSGNITTYNYDLLGRITRTNKTSGLSRTVNYDAFDRINGFTLSVLGKNISSAVNYGDFGQVNSFTNTIGDRVDTISYTYDDFYRRTGRKLEAINKTSAYTYLKGNDGQDTVLVETFDNGKDTYKYTYDIYGNITSVAKNGVVIESYVYDSFNQLTQVTKGTDVYTYTYDERGNVLSVKKNGIEEKDYTYSDSNWKDRLTNYNDTDITYDEIGNPLNWHDSMTFSWEYGRRLKGVTKGTDNISYTYDADGLRTSKTVNGTKTDYYWLDGVLQGQKTGNEHIIFLYDENGTAYGMLVDNNGTQSYYYYLFNLQGDVVGIMDSTGNTVVEYTYDAWGQLLSVTGDTALGNKNPIRYRGYYYDSETGFYLTGTRYYDPEIGRFINADGYVSTGQGVLGNNMFAYCGNNPVNRADPTGMFWKEIGDFFSKAWNGIKTWAKNTFGAGSSTTATIAEIETPVIPDPSPVTVKTGTKTTQTISKHGDSSKPISVYANKDAQHPIKSSSAGININIVNFTLDLSVGLDDIGISGSLTNGNTTNSFGVKLNLSELKIGFEGSTAIQWDNTTETAYTNASISGWAIAAAYILATTGQYVQSPSYAY